MFNPVRTVARQMLASMFITGGVDAVMNPAPKAGAAEDITEPLTEQVPALAALDTPEIVRLNGAVQVLGGLALSFGKMPRLASAALAASLVPTTLAGHRYWEESDPKARTNQQIHFFKNLSMLGGLLLSAMDTEGEPGLAWRTKHATELAGIRADHAKREAGLATDLAAEKLKARTADARAAAKLAKQRAELEMSHGAELWGEKASHTVDKWGDLASHTVDKWGDKASHTVDLVGEKARHAGTRAEAAITDILPQASRAPRPIGSTSLRG